MNLSPKINNSRLSEKEYRSLKSRLSYSSCKLYDTDREKFYREMVLGEPVKEKQSTALILGSLVHCLLAGDDGKFDDKFYISSVSKPSGQMGDLCDALYTRSLQSVNEFNEQQDSFKVIFSDAVQRVKFDFNGEEVAFKKKDESKILEMFEGSNSEMYYKSCMETIGKTVVSAPQIEQAERLVQKIKESDVTRHIVNFEDEWLNKEKNIKKIETFSELPILFEIGEVPYKCLPDRMNINHETKEIKVYDYKTSWDNESPEGSYTRYGYYLQAALYDYGVKEWAKEHKMGNYTVTPIDFVFIDVNGFNSPVVLKISKDDLDRATRGFKVRGIRYSGLTEIQESIAWNLETGIWGTTKRLYENKGIHNLNLQYGTR